jgi:hypothetical protein
VLVKIFTVSELEELSEIDRFIEFLETQGESKASQGEKENGATEKDIKIIRTVEVPRKGEPKTGVRD